MDQVLTYEQALAEVLQHAEAFRPQLVATALECVPLLSAEGRVLAEDIVAERDQPPFARSTRDGFAVQSADLRQDGVQLRLRGSIRAGEQWQGAPLGAGETLEIMTGAPVPAGADAVLMVEHASFSEDGTLRPEVGRRLATGENIVPAGAEALRGAVLVSPGRLLGAPEIGLAASCGYAQLTVFNAARVALIATGDELVELGATPEPWQIRNSNSYALAALVSGEHAIPLQLPIARDTAEDLRLRLAQALAEADLVLFSGGVSMGKYDLVEAALLEAGAVFHFTGARIQPGKPVVFGHLPRPAGARTYFFGLPGNPVSTEVCFRLFAAPFLRVLSGQTDPAPRFAEARLAEEVRGGIAVTRFLPARTEGDWNRVTVRTVPWHGSGDLAANARANSFVVLPALHPGFQAGDTVRVLLR